MGLCSWRVPSVQIVPNVLNVLNSLNVLNATHQRLAPQSTSCRYAVAGRPKARVRVLIDGVS